MPPRVVLGARAPLMLGLMLAWAAPNPASLAAQTPLVESARLLRDQGAYAAAADSLRKQLTQGTKDGNVHWMLGQLLYWMGDPAAARDEYQRALALLPTEPWLRLELGEVLGVLGDREAALEVIAPVLSSQAESEANAAEELVGRLAYWSGDYPAAIRRFEAVLARDPGHAAAARQLREIQVLTLPWVRAQAELLRDNQPFQRIRGELEAGYFPTPLWSLAAGGTGRSLEGIGAGDAWGEVRGYLPGARLQLGLRGGVTWLGSTEPRGAWTGAAELGVRLPRSTTLRALAERTRYAATLSSADTLLRADELALVLDRAAALGWAGELVARGTRFPGRSGVRRAYAWVLAPLGAVRRAGYAFSWQDAEETRWIPDSRPDPPGPPRADSLAGRYAPYFTPERVRTHSLLADLRVVRSRLTLRANGSYGFHAREDAPRFVHSPGTGGPAGIRFFERSFTPWRARGSVEWPASPSLTFLLEGERQRTTYYALNRFALSAVYRPGAAASLAAP